jgi:hypothetical protein
MVLWLVIVGRVKLPSGGRGTDRDTGDAEGTPLPDRAIGLLGCENDLPPPCGGRGMSRFIAICVGCERAGSKVGTRPNDPPADSGLGTLRLDIAGLVIA